MHQKGGQLNLIGDMTPAPPPSSPAPPKHDDDGDGERRGSGLSRRQRKNCKKREKAEKVPPAPPTIVSTASTGKKGGSKPAACKTYEKIGMSDQQIYYWIYSYCLDLIRLRRFGFPLESELHPGASVVYVDPDLAPLNELCYEDDIMSADESSSKLTSSLDVNAQEFVPAKGGPVMEESSPFSAQESELKQNSSGEDENTDSLSPTPPSDGVTINLLTTAGSTTSLNVSAKEFVPASGSQVTSGGGSGDKDSSGSSNDDDLPAAEARQCARCSRTFYVDRHGNCFSREKCLYHWGKVHYGVHGPTDLDRYTCCSAKVSNEGGGIGGCCTAKVHVWRGRLFQMPGLHGPFRNFIRTKSRKCNPPNGYHGVYALDGEMCYTTQGMELIRLSVVGIDGRPVYDTLVQPENPIVDFNTRFSGLTDRDMKNNPVKSLRNVQNDLMGFISSSTILIGHGLENDFRALRLVHTLVVDTSVLYPHYYGLPYRRSLKSLARSYLKQDIQTAAQGHDSFEDARASLELVLCKVKAEVASTVKNSNGNSAKSGIFSKLSPPSSSSSTPVAAAADASSTASSRKQLQQQQQPPTPVIPTSSIYNNNNPPPCELSTNSKSRLKYEESFVEESCWFDLE